MKSVLICLCSMISVFVISACSGTSSTPQAGNQPSANQCSQFKSELDCGKNASATCIWNNACLERGTTETCAQLKSPEACRLVTTTNDGTCFWKGSACEKKVSSCADYDKEACNQNPQAVALGCTYVNETCVVEDPENLLCQRLPAQCWQYSASYSDNKAQCESIKLNGKSLCRWTSNGANGGACEAPSLFSDCDFFTREQECPAPCALY